MWGLLGLWPVLDAYRESMQVTRIPLAVYAKREKEKPKIPHKVDPILVYHMRDRQSYPTAVDKTVRDLCCC